MGNFFKVIGLLFVLGIMTCAGGAYWFLHSTQNIADVGTHLLVAARDGKLHDEYVGGAVGLKSQLSEAQFIARANALHLNDYRDVSWLDREIGNDRAHVTGRVTLAGDKKLDLIVNMTREPGGWKLLGFQEFKGRSKEGNFNEGGGI